MVMSEQNEFVQYYGSGYWLVITSIRIKYQHNCGDFALNMLVGMWSHMRESISAEGLN